MSTGRSGTGRNQNQQIADWTEYVRSNFELTRRRVLVKGTIRKVYVARTPEVSTLTGRNDLFFVLDEWHGALEVLDDRPVHQGTIQLIFENNFVRLGQYKRGETHQFSWLKG